MRRFKRLLVAEILDKGLDPTVAYSKLDKNGKLIATPSIKQNNSKNTETYQEVSEQNLFAFKKEETTQPVQEQEQPEQSEQTENKVEENSSLVKVEEKQTKKQKQKKNEKKSKIQV